MQEQKSEFEVFKAGFEASAEGRNGEVFTGGDFEEWVETKFQQHKCDHEWPEWKQKTSVIGGVEKELTPKRECVKCGKSELGES